MPRRMETDVKTYRGRTLESLLPQIRAELGPHAVVLSREEHLEGGVGGFFQRAVVEVKAAGPEAMDGAASPAPVVEVLRNDRATTEGMASPAFRALLDQAAPFADQLLEAAARETPRAASTPDVLGFESMTDAGLYGPQPRGAAVEAPQPEPEPAPAAPAPMPFVPPVVVAEPIAAAPAAGTPALPPSAATVERRLVEAGLDPDLSAEVVGEAVLHGLPFATPRALRKLVRHGLAGRLTPAPARRPGPMTLVVVGSGGSGKTTVAGRLAAAYAGAQVMPVLAVALRSGDGGAALRDRLTPAGVAVFAAADGDQARRAIDVSRAELVIVDTPAVSGTDTAGLAALAADLLVLDAPEVHLALPATVSAAAARELTDALAALGVTHVVLTRTDETAAPGAAVGACIAARRPISFLGARESLEPADPALVARHLLP